MKIPNKILTPLAIIILSLAIGALMLALVSQIGWISIGVVFGSGILLWAISHLAGVCADRDSDNKKGVK